MLSTWTSCFNKWKQSIVVTKISSQVWTAALQSSLFRWTETKSEHMKLSIDGCSNFNQLTLKIYKCTRFLSAELYSQVLLSYIFSCHIWLHLVEWKLKFIVFSKFFPHKYFFKVKSLCLLDSKC